MSKWEEVELIKCTSETGLFADGDWIESKDQDPNGNIRLIQLADIGDGVFINKSTRFINEETASRLNVEYLKTGDILIARMPDPLGRCCIFPFDGKYITAVDVCILRTNDKVNNKFLTNIINSPTIRQKIWENRSGTTRARITRKKLSKFKIPLPPLPVQKQIVAKLDALFERIDKSIALLEENIKHTQDLMASVLDEEFGKIKNTVELKELCHLISGYAFKSGDFIQDGTKCIKITNVGVGQFVNNEVSYLPENYSDEYNRFKVNTNDLVVSLTRSFINAGFKVCKVPDSFGGSLVNQRVAGIQSIENVSNIDFIYQYLRSNIVLDYVKEKSKSLNQPNLSIKDLGVLKIPKVSISEQRIISQKLSKINSYSNELLQKYFEKLEYLKSLKSSLLDMAFKGELVN